MSGCGLGVSAGDYLPHNYAVGKLGELSIFSTVTALEQDDAIRTKIKLAAGCASQQESLGCRQARISTCPAEVVGGRVY